MQIKLTKAAIKKIEVELEQLESDRPRVTERIKHARSYGDLSENYEYHTAKEEQGLLEARIRELRAVLSRATVVEHDAKNTETIQLGSKVTVYNKAWDEEIVYTIVTMVDADPAIDKISDQSPIGEALMGKKVGEIAVFKAPAGAQELEIRKFEPGDI
ncbi:MAG: transcription elongation factor GreA [Armatimonadota bacterium]